jgi:integrase/recombinase XerD
MKQTMSTGIHESLAAIARRDEVTPLPAYNGLPDLCKFADAFAATLDVSDSSRWTYRRALKAFFDWVSNTGRGDRLVRLARFDILAYKDYLMKNVQPATTNLYLLVVQKLYVWLDEQRICADIGKGVKHLKKANGHKRDCLTAEQVRAVLAGIDRNTPAGKRDFAMVNLMARTGLREIEISRLMVGDIREETGESVLWVHGKGRSEKDEFVVVIEATMVPIQEWLKSRQQPVSADAPLFPSLSRRNYGKQLTSNGVSRIVRNAMRRAGIVSDRLTPHSLRHTAVSLAIAGGASLAQAQAMARHADPRTTMVYFHNLNRIRDAAEKCVRF